MSSLRKSLTDKVINNLTLQICEMELRILLFAGMYLLFIIKLFDIKCDKKEALNKNLTKHVLNFKVNFIRAFQVLFTLSLFVDVRGP